MNTASEPYRTARLITMSISYSRYFSTAMAMAAYRHRNARFDSTDTTAESDSHVPASPTTTTVAAAANHFSCSLSSPEDRANLTTTAVTLTSRATRKVIVMRPPRKLPGGLNGRDQPSVPITSAVIPTRMKHPPTNQAAGRHRADRRCPVGNRRNRKLSEAKGITQSQLESQRSARPAGSDPGTATRACTP